MRRLAVYGLVVDLAGDGEDEEEAQLAQALALSLADSAAAAAAQEEEQLQLAMQQSLDTLSAEAQLKYGKAGRAMSGMAAGSESLGDWHNNQLGAGALGLVRPPTPCSAPLHLINGSAPQPSSTPCQPDPSLPKHLLQDQASAAAAAGAGAAAASHEGRDCGGLAGAATGATCPGAVSAAGASTSLRPGVELGLQECVGGDAQGEGGEEEGEEGPGPEAVRVLLVEDDWEPPPPEADPADPAPGSRQGQAAPHLTIHPLPALGRAAAGGGPEGTPPAPGPAATPPTLDGPHHPHIHCSKAWAAWAAWSGLGPPSPSE
ncbi:hypothetical protein QJQ45_028647 [Haematococcus lacustris]|nr:hypothetical protein QJQ45_028647 [Haematococcus lacustris]